MPGEYSQEALQRHFAQINKRLADIEHQLKRLSDNVGLPYATFSEQFEVPEDSPGSPRPATRSAPSSAYAS